MFLFSRPIVVNRGRIHIPYDMRAALGLDEGCLVWLSRRGIRAEIKNQIILSPVRDAQRTGLWHIEAVFYDRPGIFAELVGLLRTCNIHIVDCKLTTRNHNTEAALSMAVDARLYQAEYDLTHVIRSESSWYELRELHTRIVSHFIEDIVFKRDDTPYLNIWRNNLLARSVTNPTGNIENRQIKNAEVEIPASWLDEIRSEYMVKYPSLQTLSGKKAKPVAFLVAELRYGALRITISFRNTGKIHVQVQALRQDITIATIVSELSAAKLNILMLNSRIVSSGERILLDMLLHLPEEYDMVKHDENLKRFVRGIFRKKNLTELQCRLTVLRPERRLSKEDNNIR